MPDVPRLSVILPVFNGMPYVEESVRSILAQGYRDFEFVIGDDGSRDGTSETLARLAAQDARIRLLRRERPSGLANGANWVVSAARAPVVAVTHADDRSYPDRLERQLAVLDADAGIDLVGSLWDGIDDRGRRVRPGNYWGLLRNRPFAAFSHSSIMFRKSAFERVGGYRPQAEYWEDLDFYLRIAEEGRIAVVPEVLSTVRHAPISTRLRDDRERVERAVDCMFRSVARYAAGDEYDRLLEQVGTAATLHPMTFVSYGSTALWSGRRPGVLRRLLSRARLRLDVATVHALSWATLATVSPRSLRMILRLLLVARNLPIRPFCRRRPWVDWRPRPYPSRGGERANRCLAEPGSGRAGPASDIPMQHGRSDCSV